ncbi:ABC transporter permease [Clostridium felsineum]|uniref:Spermidine/putrescine transport system permease protein PotB n=1 Tax=Clostridium felsineum TaxID=36839 RepID=A0A1S8MFN7_9CLOT|nr:ABC transporter permease [Clostridium felsineum]MCR3761288.1 ABC transporter permease [Clostridium felsineum]URZ01521.1 Spermidine/putrescine transport system permease protein PotB [Clostridium felsineum]URZ05632.1 Spermidine/putrescine transport system permease protein PotB [Clostridium felsineum]URZ10671.1 Spermidine/putrescine transport system permease protein PotB [Clostridium felsineum]URZ17414.1 Spermidine/putrescine transport system permease protein PotB [Clostridium felsineum DSM 79
MKRNRRSISHYPYILWSIIFIVIPIFLIVYFSLISSDQSFTINNYKKLFNSTYMLVFFNSIKLALISTIICFFLGYPIAYIISKASTKIRNILMLFLIIPMWMNFLLRTYAWMSILGKNGILSTIISFLGFKPLDILYTDAAVILGMVYNFLPFMIIPIYTVLIKIDKDVLKAASDLGANRFVIFKRIIFPLSIPGVMSGVTMVFMPAVSTFVISKLLGGGQFMLIGNLIESQFTTVGDWYFGSAISILMMIIILISMTVLSKFDKKSNLTGGGRLW